MTTGEAEGGLGDRASAAGPADFARDCLDAMVRQQPPPEPPDAPFYARRAACFICLKVRGELRGCIGTLTPAEPDLGLEIVRNTAATAFTDPRFSPVRGDELDELSFSVDVLGAGGAATPDELDPRVYGVVVKAGGRRGVLLPDLPGVDTVESQLAIALQKAGISADEDYEIERFTVERFAEGDAAPAS